MEGSHVTRAWEEVSRSYPWFRFRIRGQAGRVSIFDKTKPRNNEDLAQLFPGAKEEKAERPFSVLG